MARYELMSCETEFTVDKNVISVEAVWDRYFFVGGEGADVFSEGDNILLRRYYLSLPFEFGLADAINELSCRYSFQFFGSDFIRELSNSGAITPDSILRIPNLCEVNPNIFLQIPNNQERFKLTAEGKINISMINVPEVLHGKKLKAQLCWEIIHTKDLVSGY